MTDLENVNALLYSPDDNDSGVQVVMQDDTAWVTRKGMAQLFNIDVSGVTKHLKNIYETNELDEDSTCVKIAHVGATGQEYLTKYYSLDAIISVGYRVNSQKATQFRIWATNVLRQYIQDGYVVNEAALKDDPSKLNKLAAKIRELRSNEKNVFASVRECFKISASDYEPSSMLVRSFYAILQDKFHHAITRMTSSKLIIDRADASTDNMGLVSFEELFPSKKEAKIGKNYLTEDELYRMYLLSEQFLLFAESSALMGKKLTMKKLHEQLDNLLELNGYPVFDGYKDYLKDKAILYAESEYSRFIDFKKLEMLGVDVDPVEYDIGGYDDYREEMNKITTPKLKNHFEHSRRKALEQGVTNLEKLNHNLKIALNA